MKIENFSEIEEEFLRRVRDAVWCSAVTVDSEYHLHARVLHPVWENNVAWMPSNPNSFVKVLDNNPSISLTYLKDPQNPVHVECTVERLTDAAEKQRIWEMLNSTPQPLGHNVQYIYGQVDSDYLVFFKFRALRIVLVNYAERAKEWRAKDY